MQSPSFISLDQLTSSRFDLQEKNRARKLSAGGRDHTVIDLQLPSAGPVGAYLHVPFCFHKCHYCDFYSIVAGAERQEAFVERLIEEILAARPFLADPLRTIFVGGGTPTLLEAELWERLLGAISVGLPRRPDAEFTVEANPETLDRALAEVLVAGGVNRISIGAQSFQPQHLKMLGRWHEPASVERAAAVARGAGVHNINLDLIFGIPGQTLAGWLADLEAALALCPDHLSCYGLMYEPNTPMTAKVHRGWIRPVSETLEAAMYEATVERLAAAGFEQYEISSWARPDRECRHNLLYWTNGFWWPLGPAAAGHVGGVRWKNVPRLGDYLRCRPHPPITDVERLDEDGRVGEALMLGLRLVAGIPLERLTGLLARGRRGAERARAIERHVANGLLARRGGMLRLTPPGRLLADSVLADLV